MATPKGKMDEARCPMCGSPMAKSPMGTAVMQVMAQKLRGMQGPQGQPGQPGPMRRPGGR